ncbi:unconventional myosin IC-like [Daktulosphaira vitifoliae]|uniref:unconventional myosin IC-like n=1 Tax=Daktulosphaira vitifoliae TaxID=58002 RepID=UPI0021AA1ECE|nr:unconventional myosin IC-like [Daktulosphaira vitifoliae]
MRKNNFVCKRTTFIINTRRLFLRNITQTIPRIATQNDWPKRIFNHATNKLKTLHKIWLKKKFKIKTNSKRRKQIEIKLLAETLFKDKKCSYNQNQTQLFFSNERLSSAEKLLKTLFMRVIEKEKYIYGTRLIKFDRKGYKRRTRILILTNKNLYLNKIKKTKYKIVDKIPLVYINKFDITSGKDNFLLIKISSNYKQTKGDLILEIPYLIEFVTQFVRISKNASILNINRINVTKKMTHNIRGSKSGTIEFKENTISSILKGKNQNLIVSG